MKVTLSNYDVITLDALFNKSENILNNPEKFLSIKFLWALENNVSKIREAANNIRDFKQKIDEQYISDEYSTIDEENQMWRVKPEYLQDYSDKINSLYAETSDFDFKPIYIEDIEDKDISGEDFQSIKVMLVSREDEEKSEEWLNGNF